MTKFDQTKEIHPDSGGWVKAYYELAKNGVSFSYEAEYTTKNNISDVWTAVQQLNYFDDWFHSYGFGDRKAQVIETFGLGQPTPNDTRLNSAIIIQFSKDKGIIFKQQDAFFLLKLMDYGPHETLMSLRCFGFHRTKPGFLYNFFQTIPVRKPQDQSGDIERTKNRLIRLGDLTTDIKEYGQPVCGNTINGKKIDWITWHNGPGVLNVFKDEGDQKSFEINKSIREGKIGYVVPNHLQNDGKPERYFIENWYVNSYYDGVIKQVNKNHGDQISSGDRLVLIEFE